ncbi:Zinc finger protein [Fasciola gigantica]|uniref:Zinc finger protein n=1 Tax=Fasciola gigantica TaxID=46835 RepID=A0A504YKW1_FASGI|nr:Zinc finger protein [Fasciola gigantica]
MKPEDKGVQENASPETSNSATPARRPRGRPRRVPVDGETTPTPKQSKKRPRKSLTPAPESGTADPPTTPRPRGRPPSAKKANGPNAKSPRVASAKNSTSKPATKAGLAGASGNDSYSYADLFADDEEEEQDENVDAGDDDSEYAPSDEEVVQRLSASTAKRRGAAARTRRQVKENNVESESGGSTDEDEAGESESEYEDDDDDEDELAAEHFDPQDTANGGPMALFEDETNQIRKDVYDFDAQSMLSSLRNNTIRKRVAAAINNRSGGVSAARTTSKTPRGGAVRSATSWGSNIYSALAASLKTRADLDAYSSFLKSKALNQSFDQFLAELCKPSNQHASFFYGSSATLQSLMSRINDYDKVVELLHAFIARPFDQLQHRVVYFCPIVHQPLFGINHMNPLPNSLASLTENLDSEMIIRPAYVLNQDINLLVLRNDVISEFGLSNTQYHLVSGVGNLGRYMPDLKYMVVTADLYQRLIDLIAAPPERIYEIAMSRAHQEGEEAEIDISPLEPANLQRLMVLTDDSGTLLGIALLDTWDRSEVPRDKPEIPIELTTIVKSKLNDTDKRCTRKMSQEDEVKEVLDEIIDWVVLKSDNTDSSCFPKKASRADSSPFDRIHFLDAFLVKPNGRPDTLLLVAHQATAHPPYQNPLPDGEQFRIYAVTEENRFLLERHGFSPEVPIALDGVHSADPEELMEDRSLLVVPDLLYDTLRKVMLRELLSSTGTAAAASVMNPAKSDIPGSLPLVHCAKFVIMDRNRRVPLAIAFDSPIRLTLQVFTDKMGLNPFGLEACKQFDQLSSAQLKLTESAFKPTTAEYRLVSLNGLLFGFQIDDQKVVQRVVEIVPARFDTIFPNTLTPLLCSQTAVATPKSCPSSVRIVNDETNSSTVLPAFYYPYNERAKLSSVITGYVSYLTNRLYDLPVEMSLYDIVFRLAQKHMPELLARQHIEAAEAAAYAEAAANPHAPPPAPVPLPEHWGVCSLCAKELRSPNGLLDHEMRHIGLLRFRCAIHGCSFVDRRAWQAHIDEVHSTIRSAALAATLPRINSMAPADANSDVDDEEEGENMEQETAPGTGLLAGLVQVFNTGLLVGRMEAPQCEKCGDYFLTADMLAQHMDFCDGVSFCVRTPMSRSAADPKDKNDLTDNTNTTADGCEFLTLDDFEEGKNDTCVCGMCGSRLQSREKTLRHFTLYHLQCILCNEVMRSMEELSTHYQKHLVSKEATVLGDESTGKDVQKDTDMHDSLIKPDPDQSIENKKALYSKLMTCDVCRNFTGTKYNYYFHQWAEHGVVHPPLGSVDGVPQVVKHMRQNRQNNEQIKDDYFSVPSVRRIQCKFCPCIVRVSGKDYVQHLSEKHNVFTEMEVVCRICGDIFPSCEELSTHLGEVHAPSGEFVNAGAQTIFRCTQCTFWGFNKTLLKHSREAHNDPNPSIYECVHCYERFSDRRLWRTHMDKHNEGYAHRCAECGRAFRLRPSLLHHMRTHHADDQGPATCEYCGLSYPKRVSLRYHMYRMHNQELTHECAICQRRFRLETELRRHAKEIHGGAVRCEICHKVCNNLRCYAQHRQKHFRTRLYQCTDCQTTFKSKLAMKRHIRVEHLQLGPEKFECQICGKIVTQIGMHMLIHKEARFECEYCGKRFTKAAYTNDNWRIPPGETTFRVPHLS